MPRNRTQQKTAPSLTDPGEAELAETIEAHSQGATSAKPASQKKSASKKKAATKKAEPKKARYTRTHALHDALKAGGTRKEVTEELDRLYVANGGSPNPSGASAMTGLHIPVLKHFGVIEEDENGRLSFKQ